MSASSSTEEVGGGRGVGPRLGAVRDVSASSTREGGVPSTRGGEEGGGSRLADLVAAAGRRLREREGKGGAGGGGGEEPPGWMVMSVLGQARFLESSIYNDRLWYIY
jgi:hypothetical protein